MSFEQRYITVALIYNTYQISMVYKASRVKILKKMVVNDVYYTNMSMAKDNHYDALYVILILDF